MPTLRPLTEVARYDAKLFADVVAPAIRAAGYAGTLALAPDEGDVVIAASDADLDALFAGRQKTELSAMDKLRAEKRAAASSLAIRGSAAALADLVAALSPRGGVGAGVRKTRDIAGEASALTRRPNVDRVKRNGRYIKGIRPGGRRLTASVPSSAAAALAEATRAPAVPADRVQFALANLRNFIEAGLQKAGAGGVSVDDWAALVITPGEVRRES